TAKRVLIVVSRTSHHWSKAWTSSKELITIALRVLQQEELIPSYVHSDSSSITLLATERWDLRTFIVFDIFHDTYDPDMAHLPGHNDLPVVWVFFGRDERAGANIAGKPMENKVNNDIRALHDATGLGSRPPFVVDHADGKVPFYLNPRTC
ncbi:hypothetical protein V8F33_010484, partial [Rhypophila sp. PSN 637]